MSLHITDQEQLSIIQLADFILDRAIEQCASDIHLESTESGLRVRYRVDGILYDQQVIGKGSMQQLLSRLKVLARIDITERRVPQDGKFRVVRDNHEIDLRVSTFPSIYGEKIVIRILDRMHNNIRLEQLGFDGAMLNVFKSLIHRSSGLFLVTGQTGSGKTTTLYAALAEINATEKNIITLEDPVEYSVDGITQGQIHPEAGFTFEKGMRALLRQDPDIIMVGEIRDKQTGRIAIEAALTGHLVFSTLHTNDAPGAIMRLMDMGIEPFLLNAAITGVLAQRLARKICKECRIPAEVTQAERIVLDRCNINPSQVFIGKGCKTCFNLGYKGRTGIFELLQMTSELRGLIVSNPMFDAIYNQAHADGMMTFFGDAQKKLEAGVISVPELVRILS
ncbi:MAG TPA: GspE/PulE family protein [Candidatus Babeliales bacterium]|nr:GspE/PulE family protein [Candidatus Babeliales bacterium]